MESKPRVYYTDKYGKEWYKILDPRHVRLLHYLCCNEAINEPCPPLEDLKQILSISISTLHGYLSCLKKTGLAEIKLTPCPRLILTDKGRAWCEEHFSSVSEKHS